MADINQDILAGLQLGQRMSEARQNAEYRQMQIEELQRKQQGEQAINLLGQTYLQNGDENIIGRLYGINPTAAKDLHATRNEILNTSAQAGQAVLNTPIDDRVNAYQQALPELRRLDPSLPDEPDKQTYKKVKYLVESRRKTEDQRKLEQEELDKIYRRSQIGTESLQQQKLKTDILKNRTEIAGMIDSGGNILSPEMRKEQAQAFGKYQEEVLTNAKGARESNETLTELDNLLSKIKTGKGTEFIAGAKNIAGKFGVNVDENDLKNVQSAQALINRALTTITKSSGLGTGNGFTDKDREFLEKTLPSLSNTPEGNKQIIGYLRKINDRKIETAKKVQEFRKKGITNPLDIDLAINDWAEKNPLFKKEEQSAPQTTPNLNYNGNIDGIPWRMK